MTGQVLDYSIQTNEGVISGDDHQRYRFAGADWPSSSVPTRGTLVDFDIAEGNRAVSIYLITDASPAVSSPAPPRLTPATATPSGGWMSAGWVQAMTGKRVTNSLLWGGLAAFLLGMVTCSAATCAGTAAVFDPDATMQDVEAAGTAVGVGQLILVLGILAAITGAAGKVIASIRSKED